MESEMSEYLSEKSEMSSVTEAATLIRKAAEPRPIGDSVKAAIRRAAQRLGFSFSRSKDIWYGDARRIDADEMDALRSLATRYANIAATLRHQDEDFYRTQADALEYFANRIGGLGRTRD
jgi:hypothetical protein